LVDTEHLGRSTEVHFPSKQREYSTLRGKLKNAMLLTSLEEQSRFYITKH